MLHIRLAVTIDKLSSYWLNISFKEVLKGKQEIYVCPYFFTIFCKEPSPPPRHLHPDHGLEEPAKAMHHDTPVFLLIFGTITVQHYKKCSTKWLSIYYALIIQSEYDDDSAWHTDQPNAPPYLPTLASVYQWSDKFPAPSNELGDSLEGLAS